MLLVAVAPRRCCRTASRGNSHQLQLPLLLLHLCRQLLVEFSQVIAAEADVSNLQPRTVEARHNRARTGAWTQTLITPHAKLAGML